MIETVIYTYLSKKLSVPAYMSEPKTPPEKYVLIERTDGDDREVREATIAIKSYGGTLLEACKLNEELKDAMREIVELNEIAKCKLNSDYNFTDTETKRFRYQAVYGICCRKNILTNGTQASQLVRLLSLFQSQSYSYTCRNSTLKECLALLKDNKTKTVEPFGPAVYFIKL